MFDALPRSVTRVLVALPVAISFGLGACSDAATAPGAVTTTGAAVTPTAPIPSSGASALAGATLWVDPASSAVVTAESWRASRPDDAMQLDKIAAQPRALWFGDWNAD